MDRELVLVIDFGGQYNQLIARRVRENNVYCEIVPYTLPVKKIEEMKPSAIILTGGPSSVYAQGAPTIDKKLFDLDIPVLGICYGHQLIASLLQGKVISAKSREYGKANITIDNEN